MGSHEGRGLRAARNTHDLQLDSLPFELNSPNFEVHANGAQIAVCERVLGEAQEQT